jgi:hypothetical protein
MLRKIVSDPLSLEHQVQDAIGRQYWIFGGQYTGVLRRDLMPLGQHDIPLVCSDRSVHIVELKRPGSPLVKRLSSNSSSNRLVPSTEVHDAVSQCVKYLEILDETGASLQTVHHNELGLDVDYRRAKATVVIGHPDHVNVAGATREKVEQTIRSYNAHLNRVQVLTYADVLDSAERALRFEEEGQSD